MNTAFESFKETLIEQLDHSGSESFQSLSLDESKFDEQAAFALKNIFYFLGLIFRYPTETIYAEIESHMEIFGDFFQDYGGSAPALPSLDDLQPEYISLFVNNQGFVPAPPYASCYQGDGLLMNDNFHRLRHIMAKSGFVLDESVHELEDHLAVLLEFSSSLLSTLVKKNLHNKNLTNCVYALLEISYRYIEPMVADFSDKINSYAHYDFYQVAGKALKSLFQESDTIYDQLLGFCNQSLNKL
jgi:TorA maturation chaperone TorD